MNVRDVLIEALEPLKTEGYEVSLQGSYGENEPLPESFITYFIVDSNDRSFYDDSPKLSDYRIQIVFYSKKVELIKTIPDLIYQHLKAAGFVRTGKGRDISYNVEHYAWQIDYLFTERNE